MDDELDALLHLGDLLGQRSLAQLDASAGFVDEVDGLVGQEAVGNIAVGMGNRKLDSGIGVADRVELLVAVLDAHDDLDGVGFVGRRNLDGLEAAFEGAVLFDGLAILGGCGGADALNLTAREGRFEDVGGVERAFGRSGADQGVELVDKDDGVLILHQLFHDGLEALFELAAVLGAGDDEREIEGKDTFVGEEAGHFAVGDALGEAFDDGRLADAGFADQNWIIFGAAAQDLDNALQLAVASDEGIELRIHGGLGEVARELSEQTRLTLPLLLRRLFLGHAGQLVANLRQLQAALLQNLGGEALFFAQQAEEQMLGSDVFVSETLCFFGGVGQDAFALVGEGQVDAGRNFFTNGGVGFDLFANRFDRSVRAQETVG